MSDMIRHNDMTQWYECNDITQWCEQWSDSRIPLSHIIMSMQECMALSWCAMQYIGSVCFIDTSHDPIVYIIAMSHVIRVMSLILTSHINESCHRTCMGVYGSIRCAVQYMCSVRHDSFIHETWRIQIWDMSVWLYQMCNAMHVQRAHHFIRVMSPCSTWLLWGMSPIIVYMDDMSYVIYMTKSCHHACTGVYGSIMVCSAIDGQRAHHWY